MRRLLAEISAENDHPFDDMFRNILSQPTHSVGVQCGTQHFLLLNIDKEKFTSLSAFSAGSSVSTKNVGNDAGQFSSDVLQSITPSNSVDKNKNQCPLAPTEIAGKMPVTLKRKQSDLDKDEQTKAVKHF